MSPIALMLLVGIAFWGLGIYVCYVLSKKLARIPKTEPPILGPGDTWEFKGDPPVAYVKKQWPKDYGIDYANPYLYTGLGTVKKTPHVDKIIEELKMATTEPLFIDGANDWINVNNMVSTNGKITYETLKAIEEYGKKFASSNPAPYYSYSWTNPAIYYHTGLGPWESMKVSYNSPTAKPDPKAEANEAFAQELEEWFADT